MLTPQKIPDLDALIAKSQEVTTVLRTLKENMLFPGPDTIELNTLKAEAALAHLLGWSKRSLEKHLVIQAQNLADRKRAAMEAKFKRRKK